MPERSSIKTETNVRIGEQATVALNIGFFVKDEY